MIAATAGRGKLAVAVVLVAAAAAGAWWQFAPATAPPPTEPSPPPLPAIDDLPEYTQPANPGYVGWAACAECHAERTAEFARTRHAQACVVPPPDKLPAGFADGRNAITTHAPGVRFEMSRRDGAPTQSAFHDDRRTDSKIALAFGSGGHLDEVYFTWHGDRLRELPAVWLHTSNQWAFTPFDPHGEGDLSRQATGRCMECHNTWFAQRPGSPDRYDPASYVLGVGCERCHGPGQDHIAHYRKNPKPDGNPVGVVRPAELSRDRMMDVCAQCHSNAHKPRRPVLSYRPGEKLDDYYREAVTDKREEDHVANQTKYLKQSKCYLKSEMTCVTCHDPHKPSDRAVVRAACAECHEPAACKEQPRLPEAVRGDCASCHMPARVWVNVNFYTADDKFVPPIRRYEHRIAVHPTATKEVLMKHHRGRQETAAADKLADELVTEWVRQADQYQAEHRLLMAVGATREAIAIKPSPALSAKLADLTSAHHRMLGDVAEGTYRLGRRELPEAIAALERAVAANPNHAPAHGRLGTALLSVGRRAEAMEHLQAVGKHDANDAYGDGMIGWLAYLDGRPADAVAAFARADAAQPFDARVHTRWGLAMLQMSDAAGAAEHFRTALQVDPVSADAHHGLAAAAVRLGDVTTAVRHARRAAKLTQDKSADVLVTLANACEAAGRRADTEDALARAEKAAMGENAAGLLADIRRRRAGAAGTDGR